MTERVECPNCGKVMDLPSGSEGKRLRCRDCDSVCSVDVAAGGALTLTLAADSVPAAEPTRVGRAGNRASGRPTGGEGRRSAASGSRRRSRSGSGRGTTNRSGSGRLPEGAGTVLVLGILGFVACGVCAPFAWVKGNDYLRKCHRAGVRPEGSGTAGRILGIIGSVYLLIAVIWGVLTVSALFAVAR